MRFMRLQRIGGGGMGFKFGVAGGAIYLHMGIVAQGPIQQLRRHRPALAA